MESRESWERRWQLAKQRTDAKIIELHQISGNVQVKKKHIFLRKISQFLLKILSKNDRFPKCPIKKSFWNMVILGHFHIQNLEFLNYFFPR